MKVFVVIAMFAFVAVEVSNAAPRPDETDKAAAAPDASATSAPAISAPAAHAVQDPTVLKSGSAVEPPAPSDSSARSESVHSPDASSLPSSPVSSSVDGSSALKSGPVAVETHAAAPAVVAAPPAPAVPAAPAAPTPAPAV